jgi:predicted nucleotide-binding protein
LKFNVGTFEEKKRIKSTYVYEIISVWRGNRLDKDLSSGLIMAWRIAAQEAAIARCRYIEKEHIFIGICSLEKVSPAQGQAGSVPAEILNELQMEQKDIEVVLGRFGLDETAVRRQIRKMTGQGDYQHTEKVIHRSEECKQVFAKAENLTTSNKVTVLHFLGALMENPGNIIVTALGQSVSADIGQFALEIAEPTKPSDVIVPDDEPIVEQKIKTKIFIVHGRNLAPALTLKNHLIDLKLNAEMFLDSKRSAGHKTIIEILEQIKNEAGYAFIIVTPDDVGTLSEDIDKCEKALFGKDKITRKDIREFINELNTRARQNVVFEFGLFMGALGRDRTCCLVQADTKERPSDLSGLLFEEFTKDISEKFSEIDSKLKDPKIGLIKSKN